MEVKIYLSLFIKHVLLSFYEGLISKEEIISPLMNKKKKKTLSKHKIFCYIFSIKHKMEIIDGVGVKLI
jgi:hypothetical protein